MAKKEVSGQGSIVQLEKDKPKSKCRKWQLRVPVGMDPRTGKYKTRTRRFSGTYTQAKAALREFIAEIEDDKVRVRSGTTFAECVDDFMARRVASGNFSANTNETYANLLKAAVRHIGYAEVTAIEPKTLENMYAAMRKGDTTSGRPMSGTTLNALHKTISLVMDDLVEDGVLVENPCKKTATPPRDTEERRALKPERMRRLINELDAESEDENGYFLAITLGLRRAEVCGLSWEDVDFDGMVITIRRSYDHFGNLKSTKTRAGVRRLPMASFVARALARHREAQTRFLDALADKKDERFRRAEETPVMVNSKGLRTNPNNFAAHWRRDRKSLGVDGWCLHELRHSYLSMLALEGVHPKVMQDLAGHADSRTTMDIYTHVNMSQKRCAADALEAVMASAGPIEPRPVDVPSFTVIKGSRDAVPKSLEACEA